jgi:alkylhydroperoxidase family enzyme
LWIFSTRGRLHGIDYSKVAPGVLQAMLGLEKYLSQSGLDRALLNLVHLRASQINGCA